MESSPDLLETLRRVSLPSRLIEDFCPVARSLDWRLSESYWQTAGTSGFVEESVPYSSTSGGLLSYDAAQVLFANCLEDPPVDNFVVLELCAGTGLFARLFVDAFRRLCVEAGQRFHEQMTFYAADRSPATIAQWKEYGVFEGLPVAAALGDAALPLEWQVDDGVVFFTQLRAVFCNYGLDSLPSAIVRRGKNGPEELCVRTNLTSDISRLQAHAPPPLDELRAMAQAADPEISPYLSLFDVEAAFQPCQAEYPFLHECLAEFGDVPRVILNYGAISCLQTILSKLHPSGFVLINDYGILDNSAPSARSNAQQYGRSRAIGLHFPMLAACMQALGFAFVAPAPRPASNLHARLIQRPDVRQTQTKFLELFGPAEWYLARERALPQIQAGALEAGRREFETVLSYCPRDWSHLGEIGEFLIRQANDYEAGLAMCKAALALNPWYSTWLWNVYGDAYFALQRFPEALAAYKVAEEKSPYDVRTLVNLSYAYAALGDQEAALIAIARGFANDISGEYRERLREKQQAILATLKARWAGISGARDNKARRMNAC